MVSVTVSGGFDKLEKFFRHVRSRNYIPILERYAQRGLQALREATPVDSGTTADSWSYEIVLEKHDYKIVWKNSNIVDGTPIAIILQFGHATRSGGFVEGYDYINPALKPVFDEISEVLHKEVMG